MVDVSTYGDVLVRDINLRNASLYSNDASNEHGSRLSSINFYGRQEGSVIPEILGQIKVSHDGTGSDNKGKFVFQVNDNSSMVDVFEVDSNKRTTIPKITVSEDLTVNTQLSANNLNVASNTTTQTLDVNSTANLNSGVHVTGTTTLTGNLTQDEGFSTSLKELSVAGNSTLNSANVTNDLTVSGNSNLNGPLTVAANQQATFNGPLSVAVDQETTLGGNLTVAAGKQTQLNGPLTVANDQQTTVGSLTVNGDFSAGNINFDGANVTGDVSCDNLTATTSITSNGALTAGETSLNGSLTVGSNFNRKSTILNGSLTVSDGEQTQLNGPLTVATDKSTNLGGNLAVSKQTTLGGLLVAMNSSNFQGPVIVGTDLVSQSTTLKGPLTVDADHQATFNGPLTVADGQQTSLDALNAGATIVDSINVTNASNLNGPLNVATGQQTTVDVLDAGATTLDSLTVEGAANFQELTATSTNFNDMNVSDKMSIGPISPSDVSKYTLALTSQGTDVANPPTLRFDLVPSDGDIASAENDIYGRIDFTARDNSDWRTGARIEAKGHYNWSNSDPRQYRAPSELNFYVEDNLAETQFQSNIPRVSMVFDEVIVEPIIRLKGGYQATGDSSVNGNLIASSLESNNTLTVTGNSTLGELVAGGSTLASLTVTNNLVVNGDGAISATGGPSTLHSATVQNDLTANNATVQNDLTVSNNLIVNGNISVHGTTTTINTANVSVEDHQIELGNVETPTDLTAESGGLLLKGNTDKLFTWESSNSGAWKSSENVNVETGKGYYSGGNLSLDETSLYLDRVGNRGEIYLGSPTADKTWRVNVSNTGSLRFQQYSVASSSWVTKWSIA